MQIHITIDLTGESLETQLEMARKATRLVKEIEKEFGAPEENDPERIEVIPKAFEEHLMREKRQREMDKKRLDDLGIRVDVFQSDSSEDGEQKEGLETTRSGLDVVEPTMYNIFLNMSSYEFGRFINNWTRRHLKDGELCVGQVERMFQTPIYIFKQQFNHPVKK